MSRPDAECPGEGRGDGTTARHCLHRGTKLYNDGRKGYCLETNWKGIGDENGHIKGHTYDETKKVFLINILIKILMKHLKLFTIA